MNTDHEDLDARFERINGWLQAIHDASNAYMRELTEAGTPMRVGEYFMALHRYHLSALQLHWPENLDRQAGMVVDFLRYLEGHVPIEFSEAPPESSIIAPPGQVN